MREVARRAGCTHQAPYHYFTNREAILAELVREGFEELADRLSAVHDARETEGLRQTVSASRAGIEVELSPTEFKLLRYLMLNAGRVVSKAQILDHVWEYDWNGDAAIVESYISYLRRKVDQIDGRDGQPVTPLIQTRRGVGYMLREPKAE